MARFFSHTFSIDSRSLALLRISLGLLVMLDVLTRSEDLLSHYSDQGVYPLELALAERSVTHGMWSLLFIHTSPAWTAIIFAFTCAAGFTLALGWKTRWMNIICFLLVCSIQNRIPNNTGGDTILRMLLFWMMFLPSGLHWSMDYRRHRCHSPKLICTAATAALLLQVCFIYWFSSIFKNDPAWRVHHTAVHLTFGVESFQLPLAAWLLNHPHLTGLMTRATLFLQEIMPVVALAPIASFWRIRTIAAVSFMAFHLLGLGLTMRLGLFPLIAAAAWLPFLPPQVFGIFARRTKEAYSSSPSYGTCNEDLALPLSPPLRGATLTSYVPLVFLLQIFWWNLANIFPATAGKSMPAWVRSGTYWSGINQYWAFFSPRPATRDGWYVAVATLRDGSQIDLMHDGSPVSWSKPPDGVASEYPNSRWQKYLTSMFSTRRTLRIQAFVLYLRNRWEKLHPDRSIASLELYFMLQDNFYPSDGIRRVRVFPFRSVNDAGSARFEGDLRQDALDAPAVSHP